MVNLLLVKSFNISGYMLGTSKYPMKGNPTEARNKISNKRKAISPVIATVILVAVAVVIAAAMAGFAGSLFGTYSQTSQIKIRDATFSNANKQITMDLVNSGSSPESLNTVSVPVGAVTLTATGAAIAPSTLQPNTTTTVVATLSGGAMPAIGQQVTFTAVTSGGQSYTFSVVVSA
jgi:flagellin-like protein